mgnify:CR=1 FL=1
MRTRRIRGVKIRGVASLNIPSLLAYAFLTAVAAREQKKDAASYPGLAGQIEELIPLLCPKRSALWEEAALKSPTRSCCDPGGPCGDAIISIRPQKAVTGGDPGAPPVIPATCNCSKVSGSECKAVTETGGNWTELSTKY